MNWIVAVIGMLFTLNVSAMGVHSGFQGITLGSSEYVHFGYLLGLTFGDTPAIAVNAGLTHPYEFKGYHQTIYNIDACLEWTTNVLSWVKAYGGLGLGAYSDRVGASRSVIPSLVTRGGLRLGGKISAQFEMTNYFGVYSLEQLVDFTNWSRFHFFVGVSLGN